MTHFVSQVPQLLSLVLLNDELVVLFDHCLALLLHLLDLALHYGKQLLLVRLHSVAKDLRESIDTSIQSLEIRDNLQLAINWS